MSAGTFVDAIYVTDAGDKVNIRVQPETINLTWNTAGTGTVDTPGSANATGGRRRNGINARIARFKWKGEAPTGYLGSGIITLPILTKTKFDALVKNTDYAYLGGTINLVGRTNESIR